MSELIVDLLFAMLVVGIVGLLVFVFVLILRSDTDIDYFEFEERDFTHKLIWNIVVFFFIVGIMMSSLFFILSLFYIIYILPFVIVFILLISITMMIIRGLNKEKWTKMKTKRMHHPMWLFSFLILGLVLFTLLSSYATLLFCILIGIVFFIFITDTPSSTVSFQKNRSLSVIVWSVVSVILLLLIVNLIV